MKHESQNKIRPANSGNHSGKVVLYKLGRCDSNRHYLERWLAWINQL